MLRTLLGTNILKLFGGHFNVTKRIALVRAGAIGDVTLLCNVIPLLRAKYPDYTIDFYTKTFGLEPVLKLAGVDNIFDCSVLEPDSYETVKYLIGYPVVSENYPNNGPMKKHLLEYFSQELGV